jgi:hypothetical protein
MAAAVTLRTAVILRDFSLAGISVLPVFTRSIVVVVILRILVRAGAVGIPTVGVIAGIPMIVVITVIVVLMPVVVLAVMVVSGVRPRVGPPVTRPGGVIPARVVTPPVRGLRSHDPLGQPIVFEVEIDPTLVGPHAIALRIVDRKSEGHQVDRSVDGKKQAGEEETHRVDSLVLVAPRCEEPSVGGRVGAG